MRSLRSQQLADRRYHLATMAIVCQWGRQPALRSKRLRSGLHRVRYPRVQRKRVAMGRESHSQIVSLTT
jgi:hypothetical protein